ncbi:sensor histidine kinase [Nocardioides korecus]
MSEAESAAGRREREVRRYGVVGVPQPELDDLAVLATQLCHVPAAAINLMQSGTQATVAAVGIARDVCALEDAMCSAILDDGHPVQVPDASLDPRWAENPFVNGEKHAFRYYSAHQLVSPRGVVIGTMCAFDTVPREADAEGDLQLEQLAHRVVDFLELRLRTRQLEESVAELTEARAELERSNDMLRLFAAQVAHDLRGPITAVDASLQMLRDGLDDLDAPAAVAAAPVSPPVTASGGRPLPPPEPASWLIDRALGSVGRMNDLIRDVLAFASIGGVPEIEELDLRGLVDQLRDDLAAELEGVRLETGGLPVVHGDRTQWRVVLQNLISNAVKFNDRDDAVVRVHAVPEDGRWCLEVSDNGPGVPVEDRERIFGLLAQGNPDGDGIGLGLATCWRIVEAHGGQITMGETPEGGALVRITVPYVAPNFSDVAPVRRSRA